MKNQLLLSAIFLLCAFAGRSQCEPSPYCDLTPLFCGAVLDGYQGSTAGYPPPSSWVPFCGTLENPQFLKIITCSDLLDLSILSSNCQNGNGVQIALYTDCDNPEMVTCEEGFPGNAGGLLSIIATVETNTPYVLMIDGYAGDICDFVIDVNSGLDVWQSSSQPAQNGYIELDTLPCGPAQLTAHLPICWSDAPASPGCSISWQNSLATNCTGFNWNLPPGVEIVSNDPNAQTITIQFTQPVVNGIVSVNTYSSCWDICPTCGPNGCAGGFIPPLVISSDSSTFTYLPCQEAPFYCGNTLDGATISTVCTSSGFEWANPLINIQPDVDVFCYPIDNPNLYGFSSCSNQLSMSIQVDSCEKGKGLEFAVLYSNHCGSFMRISDCIAVQEDATAMLSFSNPYPGQPLYLAVDGLDFDACTFHIDVPDSVGSQAPTYIATDCAPEITGVVNTVCAGGVYTFKIEDLSGTSCVINAWNVISSYCAPPGGACKLLDSVEVTWTLPPFLHPIGDDNGPVLKVWADSSFATNDTLFSAVIRADIFTIATPTGLIDGFCGCANFSKQYESEFWIDAYSTVAKIPLTLSCLQPCVTVGSVTYCDPGEYIIAINGCQVYKHIVTKTDPPLVSSPVIQQNDDSYTVSFSVSPSNGTVVTGGGSFQNGTFTSLPIACGQPYAFNVITGSCTQTVSGSAACYLPPDCNNFNIPAPPGDSCHQAPLLCGNFLEGYCSTTAGLLPDQPAYLTSPLPDFENNGWLRFSPCEDSISIDFQVFDCQVGNELGFFLLSGDCDTLTPLAFTSATDGNIANLSVGGLNPGEVYYLVVDGFYGSECKFQVHVVSGIGTASPGLSTCTCTDGYIDGPGDLCPADIAVYTLILPSCDITSDPPFGGNGIYCPPPPSVCPAGQDSLVLHWVIPPFMNFLSDSINVLQITTQVDSAFLGQDTLLNGTVSVYWEVVDLPGDTIAPDTNAFCSCQSATCDGDINFKDVTVHHDVDYDYGVISCVNPCYFYNGVPYCQAGTYLVSQDNCHTQFLILVEDFSFPQANAGPDQTICLGEDATLGIPLPNSPIYSYYWDNGAFTPQTTVAPTNTTSYSLVVTNVFNGCTATDNVTVTVMPSIPATNLPPTSICEGECLLFAGEIICPSASGMQTTMLQSWFGCDSLVTQFIVVQPLLQIDLGVAGTIDCQNPSVDVMGNIYTQPGVYIIDNPGTCTAYTFTIAGNVEPVNLTLSPAQTICAGESVTLAATTDVSGSVLFNWSTGETGPVITVSPQTSAVYSVIATDPQNGCTGSASTQVLVNQPQTIQLGVVETLNCTQPCVTYNGETYCQPGSYSYTANCEVVAFEIAYDETLPTVQLGVVETLSCTQPCVTYNGETYCQPGSYSYTANCEVVEFEIAYDETLPTVQLGVVETLNCAQPCVTYNGETYCQPGSYSYTANCEVVEFEIAYDETLPTLQLGVVETLSCTQPCVTYNGETYCQPGSYSYMANCEVVEFEIAPQPVLWVELGSDETVDAGELVNLTAQTNAQTVNVSWYAQGSSIPGSGLDIQVQPLENTLYSIEIEEPGGCLLSDSVWVFVIKANTSVFAPNVIKPGSGENGWFTLYASSGYVVEIEELSIYNRWGEQIFLANGIAPGNPEKGWDGTFKGKRLDPDVFVWQAVLRMEDGSTLQKTGDVTLLR